MAETLLFRELFIPTGGDLNTDGLIDATHPGGFTTFAGGPIYKRRVGPYLTDSPGWSADMRFTQFDASKTISGAAVQKGAAKCFLNLSSKSGTDNLGAFNIFFLVNDGSGNALFEFYYFADATRHVFSRSRAWPSGTVTDVDHGDLLTFLKWVGFMMEYVYDHPTNPTTYDIRFSGLDAAGTKTVLRTVTGIATQAAHMPATAIWSNGYSQPGSAFTFDGRIGGCEITSIDTLGDAAMLVTGPPSARQTFYTKASATGTNSGESPAKAFSPTQLVTELLNNGILGRPVPWVLSSDGTTAYSLTTDIETAASAYEAGTIIPAGDKVSIDAEGGIIRLSTALTLGYAGEGVEIYGANGGSDEIRWVSVLPNAGWTVHSGAIYKLAFANTQGVLYEGTNGTDGKLLTHPTAANVAAYVAIATAGSFWTDGTTIYYWPTGSTDPNADGKVKEMFAGTSGGGAAIAGNYVVRDLVLGYTMGVNNANDPSTGRLQDWPWYSGVAGLKFHKNLKSKYFGKHAHGTGRINLVSDRNIFLDCAPEQGPPTVYVGTVGGQSAWIANPTSGTDCQMTTRRCTTLKNVALIGSTAGDRDIQQAVFYGHGGNLSKIVIDNCNFIGGHISIDNACADLLTIKNDTHCRGAPGVLVPIVVDWSSSDYYIFSSTVSNAITNNTIVPVVPGNFAGPTVIEGNSIDLKNMTNVGGFTDAYNRNGAVSALSFRDNLCFAPTSADNFVPIGGLVVAELASYTFSNNLYQAASGLTLAYDSGGGQVKRTLAYWQSQGKDLVVSAVVADLKWATGSYNLLIDSPAIGVGISLASLAGKPDFYGKTRPATGALDIGASQFARPGIKHLSIGLGLGI